MHSPTSIESLKEQLLELRKRVVLLELKLECARLESSRLTNRSDLGWLFSINASAGGTVAAVLNGKRAGGWIDQAAELEHELLRLIMDQKILEHEIARRAGADALSLVPG